MPTDRLPSLSRMHTYAPRTWWRFRMPLLASHACVAALFLFHRRLVDDTRDVRSKPARDRLVYYTRLLANEVGVYRRWYSSYRRNLKRGNLWYARIIKEFVASSSPIKRATSQKFCKCTLCSRQNFVFYHLPAIYLHSSILLYNL